MKSGKRPKGREQVMASVLKSASDLFARRGVDAVSLRQIAAKAKVNHGLIHRHFGSKEKLRLQVQDYLAEQIRIEVGTPETAMDAVWKTLFAVRKHEAFWRVMARTFLDGKFKGSVQSSFPFMFRMIELVKNEQQKGTVKTDLDPRLIVAGLAAMGLGLMVFGKYLLPSTSLDDDDPGEVINKIIITFVESITT